MVKNTITIGHLYPKQMNVYGDMGNVITLRYRLESRGYKVEYIALDSLGGLSQKNIDILIGGGGQDSNQTLIQNDLKKYATELKAECEEGLVGLMVCGMYQLFGKRFVLSDTSEITGAGVFDIETFAGTERLIGNVVVESPWGKLVGFENHSGRTFLGTGTTPLGTVQKGAGNNNEDKTEGAVVNNVFGTYMHGPILAKNPGLADEILVRALTRQGVEVPLEPLEDSFEISAATIAALRPR
ncbi:glutamine amidotransferase [Candidatus Saccharibacteria bacterium]|nr:glutamine amidotransferase [Candidatus Saccharibacteria bacterium]